MNNELIVRLQEKWSAFSARDKKTLLIGGLAAVILLTYALIWSPFYNAANATRGEIIAKIKTLNWMQMADKQLSQSAPQTDRVRLVNSPVELLSVLQAAITTANLEASLSQLKQINSDTIAVQFKNVEFDKLLNTLSEFVAVYPNVQINQTTIVATPTSGMVNADLILKLTVAHPA